MKKRPLGHSDLEVSPFCFGGNVLGWTVDAETSFRLLDAFLGAGFNFIDSADVYARWQPGSTGGDSERVLGDWLAARRNRDQVVLVTKVGGPMPGGKGLSAAYIQQAVEASLSRLKTDYIDLYLSHHDDPETPVEETLQAYADLIQQGKVRYIGASNFTAERLQQALEVSRKNSLPRYQALQPQYSLMERSIEADLLPLCQREGLGVFGYYSLASGFLTGKYRTEADLGKSVRGRMLKGYLGERGQRVLKALDDVSARTGATLAQISLAWLMDRPGVTAPIASASNLDQLSELLKAVELKLSPEDMELLDKAS
ncbi:MAG: NADP-dependent aryl-alcohol dehydrogenase [Candidatus Xenobia bacterium]